MKITLKLMFLCLMLTGFFRGMAQTNVTLTFHNGSTQEIEVSASGKIYFSDNYMYIDDGTSVPFSFDVANIRNMTFSEVLGVRDVENETFSIYPNPVHNEFSIHANDATTYHYTLFALDGRLLLDGIGQDITSVSMDRFPAGLYILKINNTSFKINKL